MKRLSKEEGLAYRVTLGIVAALAGTMPLAQAAPTLDSVVAGGATVNVGTSTTITSSTTDNVINWTDFSIARNETVKFDGGAKTNNYLNIVTGQASSYINGAMTGGNNVYVVNPNGITIGKDANIDVGSLYLSTRTDTSAINTATAPDLSAPSNVISNASNTTWDVVNLGGKVQATQVAMEGKNVRLLNTENFTSDGSTPLSGANVTIKAANDGYVHIGYSDVNNKSSALNYTVNIGGSSVSAGGAADYDDYKLISTYDELKAIDTSTTLDGNYMLADNIDASASASDPLTPMGGTAGFTGKIDGNFYRITDLTLNVSNTSNINKTIPLYTYYGEDSSRPATYDDVAVKSTGMFGYTKNARIDNIGLVNLKNNASSFDDITANVAGSIVGYAENTKLRNVYNKVTTDAISAAKNSEYKLAITSYMGTISDTSTHKYLVANNNAGVMAITAGGLVGVLDGGSLSSSYNSGVVRGGAGLVGYLKGGTIKDAYNIGQVYNDFFRNHYGFGIYVTATNGSAVTNAYSVDEPISSYKLVSGKVLETTNGDLYLNNDSQIANLTNTHLVTTSDTSPGTYGFFSSTTDSEGNTIYKTANDTWRIYEGYSLPLLRSFLQANGLNAKNPHPGIMQVDEFPVAYFNGKDDATEAALATRSGVKNEIPYSGYWIGPANGLDTGGDPNLYAKNEKIKYVDESISGWFYAKDQDGYDLADNNTIKIVARNLAPDTTLDISKIYDGTTSGPDSSTLMNTFLASTAAGTATDNGDGTYTLTDGSIITLKSMSSTDAGLVNILSDTGILAEDVSKVAFKTENGQPFKISYGKKDVGNYALDTDGTVGDSEIGFKIQNGNNSYVQLATWHGYDDDKRYDYTQDYILTKTDSDTGTTTDSNTVYAYQNYTFNPTGNITGTITPRTVYVKLDHDTGIDKVYDGNNKVNDLTTQNNVANVFETYANAGENDTGYSNKLISTDAVALVKGTGVYGGKDAAAYNNTNNATTRVTYKGITLSGSDAKNYKLVAGSIGNEGDTLYEYDYVNQVVATSDGELYGSGTINKRGIDSSYFRFGGESVAHRKYNGATTYDITGAVFSYDGSVTDMSQNTSSTTGIIKNYTDSDGNTVAGPDITLSLGNTANFSDSTGNTLYKDAGTGYYLKYSVGSGSDNAKNYYIINHESEDLRATGGVGIVGAEGSYIDKRNIIIAASRASDIDKTYDGTTTLSSSALSLGNGLVYGDNSDFLLNAGNVYTDANNNTKGNGTYTEGGVNYTDDTALSFGGQYDNPNVYVNNHKLVYEAADTALYPNGTTDASLAALDASGDPILKRNSHDIGYIATINGNDAKNYTITLTTDSSLAYSTNDTGTSKVNTNSDYSSPVSVSYGNMAKGKIEQAELGVSINAAPSKEYDTSAQVYTSDVVAADTVAYTITPVTLNDIGADNITLTGAVNTAEETELKTRFANAFANSALNGFTADDKEDTTPINAYFGTYDSTAKTFTQDANVGSKDVQYNGLASAWTDGNDEYYLTNYKIADTAYGTGTINKYHLTDGNFHFTFKPLTKEYNRSTALGDGTTLKNDYTVAINNSNINTAVDKHYISLHNNHTLDFDYNVTSLTFDNYHAADNHNLNYSLTLSGISTSNFDSAGMSGNTFSGTTTDAAHQIRPKTVYAAVKDKVTKTYNAKTNVLVNGNAPNAADLIDLTLITGDTFTATGKYDDKNVGTDKDVTYTIDIGESAGDYNVLMDNGNGGFDTVLDATSKQQSGTMTGYGDITVATVTPVFNDGVGKFYDGSTKLTNLKGSVTPGYTLNTVFSDDNGILDDLTLDTYDADFDNANTGTGKTITYKNFMLTGTDKKNYVLSANEVTTSGNYIDPLKLGPENLRSSFDTITKVYDATLDVTYTNTDNTVDTEGTWRKDDGSFGSHYLKSLYALQGSAPINLTWSGYKAAYGSKNVADNTSSVNNVTYTFTLNNNMGNYSIIPFANSSIKDAYDESKTYNASLSQGTNGVYTFTINTTGTITKKDAYATVSGTPEKDYDGTTTAGDLTDSITVTGLLNDLDNSSYAATGTYDTANVAYDGNIVTAGRTVTYDVNIDAANAGNYNLLYGTEENPLTVLTTKGKINPKKIGVNFAYKEKAYDGNYNVTLAGTDVTLTGLLDADSSLNSAYQGNVTALAGNYAVAAGTAYTSDANVNFSEDTNSVLYKGVVYTGLNESLNALRNNGNTIAGNYKITKAAVSSDLGPTLTGTMFDDTTTLNDAANSDGVFFDVARGAGKITQRDLNWNDLTPEWNQIRKIYDGTDAVKHVYGTSVIGDAYAVEGADIGVTKGLNLYFTDNGDKIPVDYTYSKAVYDNGNVGQTHNVTYRVTGLSAKDLHNFTVSNLGTKDFDSADSSVYGIIAPRLITATTTDGQYKIYDGATAADKSYFTLDIGTADTETGILAADLGKITWEANYTDKNANVDAKPDPAVNGKTIKYKLYLSEDGTTYHNYALVADDVKNNALNSINNVLTDDTTYTSKGDIGKRPVYVDFDDTRSYISKGYNGNTNANAVKLNLKARTAADSAANEGILDGDVATLDNSQVQATYDTANVKRGSNGNILSDKVVTYQNFALTGNDAANYLLANTSLTGTGEITPVEIDLNLVNPTITKTYDDNNLVTATNNAAFPTLANVKFNGTAGSGSSYDVTTALGDTVNVTLAATPTYSDQNVSRDSSGNVLANKDVTYNLSWDNGNYELKDSTATAVETLTRTGATVDSEGIASKLTGNLVSHQGQINPRNITAQVTSVASKPYDGDAAAKALKNGSYSPNVTDYITVTDVLTGNTGWQGDDADTADVSGTYTDGKNVLYAAEGNVRNDRTVNYALNLGDNTNNYNVTYLNHDNTAGTADNWTGLGEITPKTITADFAKAAKPYDGNNKVKELPTVTLNDLVAGDSALNTAYRDELTANPSLVSGQYQAAGSYSDSDVSYDANGNVVAKPVTYTGLQGVLDELKMSSSDADIQTLAGNYQLADTLSYTASDNKGQINPLTIELGDIKHQWINNVTKVYDTEKTVTEVYDPADTQKANNLGAAGALRLYVDGVDTDLSYSLGNATYNDKNVGTGKDLTYDVSGLSVNTQGNYNIIYNGSKVTNFSGSYTTAGDNANIDGSFSASITPYIISNATVDPYSKVYDGSSAATNTDFSRFLLDNTATLTMSGDFYNDDWSAKDANARDNKNLRYTLTLSNNTLGNYSLDAAALQGSATETKSYDTAGNIRKRPLYGTLANDGYSSDKPYDGTVNVSDPQTINLSNFIGSDGSSMNVTAKAAYDSANVKRANDGSAAYRNINYSDLVLGGNGNVTGNYYLATSGLTGQGKITPVNLAVSVIDPAVTKEYDGTVAVPAGYDSLNNVSVDKSALIAGDTVNVTLGNTPEYDNPNAGNGKNITYQLAWDNGNYNLALADNATNGVSWQNNSTGSSFSGNLATAVAVITPRELDFDGSNIGAATKVYDGDAHVKVNGSTDASGLLTPALNTARLLSGENVAFASVTGEYADSNAATAENEDYASQNVTYTFGLSNPNYKLKGITGNTVTGSGTITRAPLTLAATPQQAVAGMVLQAGFSGNIANDYNDVLTGVNADDFAWAPEEETYGQVAGQWPIYGWYNGNTSGNYGLNYTFAQDPANETALTITPAKTPDNPINPGDVVTPDHNAYTDASKDHTSSTRSYVSDMTIRAVTANGSTVALEDGTSGDNSAISLSDVGRVVSLTGGDSISSDISLSGDGQVVSLNAQNSADNAPNTAGGLTDTNNVTTANGLTESTVSGLSNNDAASANGLTNGTDTNTVTNVNGLSGNSVSDIQDSSGLSDLLSGSESSDSVSESYDAMMDENGITEVNLGGSEESGSSFSGNVNSDGSGGNVNDSAAQDDEDLNGLRELGEDSSSADNSDMEIRSAEEDALAADSDTTGKARDDDKDKEKDEETKEGEDKESAELKSVDLGVNMERLAA